VNALYITYDGVLEPLGESQVLPYVRGLARRGVRYTLVSFEKPVDLSDAGRVGALRSKLAGEGIRWIALRYHKRPTALATTYDILLGALTGVRAVVATRIRLVHARSYVAGVMAWLITRVTAASMLFDMRGFWVDERVEGGLWSREGTLYRMAKRWERRLLRDANGIVVLSHAAVPHLEHLAGAPIAVPVRVVPTCVDLERFRPGDRRTARATLGIPEDAFVLIYVGSFGTWYMGPETFVLAQAIAELASPFLFVLLTRAVQEASELVPTELRDRTRIGTATHDEVASWLAAADAGVALVRPSFSKVASCPTKLGEYLACGLPVASTRGIGDVDRILEDGGGVLLPSTDQAGVEAAAQALVGSARADGGAARCRRVAEETFSLEAGVEQLRQLYDELEPAAC
jgi:glycosyltransferase involved in cell wall biosynthesis